MRAVSLRSVMPILMTTLTWMVRKLQLTDKNVVSLFGSHELFAWCCAPFFYFCDHGAINTTLCREVGQIVTGR